MQKRWPAYYCEIMSLLYIIILAHSFCPSGGVSFREGIFVHSFQKNKADSRKEKEKEKWEKESKQEEKRKTMTLKRNWEQEGQLCRRSEC